MLVSDQAGKSNLIHELEQLGVPVGKDDRRLGELLEAVKAREGIGYAYEGADASFELLARRLLGEVPEFFRIDSFRVMVEKRHNALGNLVTVSEATVKVYIDGDAEPLWSVAEGNGPVNALDQALRKDLGRYQKHIQDVELVDYKVRILTGGTEAITRVLVESRDKSTGERWFTVGVSPNIVDASFEALIELDHLQAPARRCRGVGRNKATAALRRLAARVNRRNPASPIAPYGFNSRLAASSGDKAPARTASASRSRSPPPPSFTRLATRSAAARAMR